MESPALSQSKLQFHFSFFLLLYPLSPKRKRTVVTATPLQKQKKKVETSPSKALVTPQLTCSKLPINKIHFPELITIPKRTDIFTVVQKVMKGEVVKMRIFTTVARLACRWRRMQTKGRGALWRSIEWNTEAKRKKKKSSSWGNLIETVKLCSSRIICLRAANEKFLTRVY